jgi:hypothetical protein
MTKKLITFHWVGYDLGLLKAHEEFGGVRPSGQAKTSEDAKKILRQMSLNLKKIVSTNKRIFQGS